MSNWHEFMLIDQDRGIFRRAENAFRCPKAFYDIVDHGTKNTFHNFLLLYIWYVKDIHLAPIALIRNLGYFAPTVQLCLTESASKIPLSVVVLRASDSPPFPFI